MWSVGRGHKSRTVQRLRATRFLVRTNLAIIGQTIVGRAGWRSGRDGQSGSSMADVVRARLEDPDHRRRRIARAKERRAFLVLGIVMASFVGCWLPFFFVYLVTSRVTITTPGWRHGHSGVRMITCHHHVIITTHLVDVIAASGVHWRSDDHYHGNTTPGYIYLLTS